MYSGISRNKLLFLLVIIPDWKKLDINTLQYALPYIRSIWGWSMAANSLTNHPSAEKQIIIQIHTQQFKVTWQPFLTWINSIYAS